MTVAREARFLSGTDIGRTLGPLVAKTSNGLSYRRSGRIIGVLQTAEGVEIYLEHNDDDPFLVDRDTLVEVTGDPSDRPLEIN